MSTNASNQADSWQTELGDVLHQHVILQQLELEIREYKRKHGGQTGIDQYE